MPVRMIRGIILIFIVVYSFLRCDYNDN
jgi:hypothetical protein